MKDVQYQGYISEEGWEVLPDCICIDFRNQRWMQPSSPNENQLQRLQKFEIFCDRVQSGTHTQISNFHTKFQILIDFFRGQRTVALSYKAFSGFRLVTEEHSDHNRWLNLLSVYIRVRLLHLHKDPSECGQKKRLKASSTQDYHIFQWRKYCTMQ